MGWEKEAMGDFLCRHCKQARDAGPVELTFRKQDGAWGVQKRTSPSKREGKKRKGLAAKRDETLRPDWREENMCFDSIVAMPSVMYIAGLLQILPPSTQ